MQPACFLCAACNIKVFFFCFLTKILQYIIDIVITLDGVYMKISTEIDSAAKIIGEEKAIEHIANSGFDAWDFSMFAMCKYDWKNNGLLKNDHPLAGSNYLKFAKRLKQTGIDNGIHCNQSHAPFPVYCSEIRTYLKRAIECTAEAGGKICVIHPDNYKNAQENFEIFDELLPFAKEYGVKIATENMWNWDQTIDCASFAACATPKSFCEHIDVINSDNFVACLDIGHAEMRGLNTNAVEMILALNSRLQALHIHDNDLWHDSHQIPFSMSIDYKPILTALKKIGYDGYFTLEANQYLNSYTADNIFIGIKNLAESAKKLVKMYKNIK